jgi:hypothetical protein
MGRWLAGKIGQLPPLLLLQYLNRREGVEPASNVLLRGYNPWLAVVSVELDRH